LQNNPTSHYKSEVQGELFANPLQIPLTQMLCKQFISKVQGSPTEAIFTVGDYGEILQVEFIEAVAGQKLK